MMAAAGVNYELTFLRLLEFSPFERRPRGGWRFGTKVISDDVVGRLTASGRAFIDGDQVRLVPVNDDEPVTAYNQALAQVAEAIEEA
jgi:hypothetical protein